MSLKGLLNETPSPSEAQLLRAVTGNLCRCGAYLNILQAGRLDTSRAEATPGVHAVLSHVNAPAIPRGAAAVAR